MTGWVGKGRGGVGGHVFTCLVSSSLRPRFLTHSMSYTWNAFCSGSSTTGAAPSERYRFAALRAHQSMCSLQHSILFAGIPSTALHLPKCFHNILTCWYSLAASAVLTVAYDGAAVVSPIEASSVFPSLRPKQAGIFTHDGSCNVNECCGFGAHDMEKVWRGRGGGGGGQGQLLQNGLWRWPHFESLAEGRFSIASNSAKALAGSCKAAHGL